MSKAKVRERRIIPFLSLVLVVAVSTEARADLYVFDLWEPITNNSGYEDEFAQGLSLEVTDEGVAVGKVLFTFYNNSTIDPHEFGPDTVGPGAITDIYVDDGSVTGISYIINPAGVLFDKPANPADLPGGNNVDPPFVTSLDGYFSADADTSPLGVDPGEYVGIVFDIGSTFADVIDAINLGFTYPSDSSWYDDSLRFGVHVSNLGLDNNSDDEPGDYSDSYIMTPIPASVVLGILGLGVVGLKLRKFA